MVVKLTNKELKVIKMRFKGLKNQEIAEALDVSEPDISQTLSRIVDRVSSIQDTLELMSRVGIIESDVEIKLTESGETLLARWRQTRPSRLAKLKMVRDVQVPQVESKEAESSEKTTDYTFVERIIEKKVGDPLKEITEQLNVLSSWISEEKSTPKTLTQEKKPAKPIKKEIYR